MGTVFGVLLLIMILLVVGIILYKRNLLPAGFPGYLNEQTPMHFSNPAYTSETDAVEILDATGLGGFDNPVYSSPSDTVDVLDATIGGDDSVAEVMV